MERVELRAAEVLSKPAAVRALLEGAAEAFMAVNRDGDIVLVNRMAEAMFGYERKELVGQPFGTVLPESVRADCSAQWPGRFGAPGTHEPVAVHEVSGLKKSGAEFPIEVRLSIIETELGPLAFGFITDSTERRRSESALRESREKLGALARRLISAEEESRKQLARDLHDALGQRVAMISMEASALEQEARDSAPELRERLTALGEQIVQLAKDARRLSLQLHPSVLTDIGLAAALESECAAFTRLYGTPAKLASAHIPSPLPEEVRVALYRIAQEALRNAAKHAQANEIRLSLESHDNTVVLRIEDNGLGLDPAARKPGGLGLVSIEERARLLNGSVRVESRPGKGACLEIEVPLDARREDSPDVSG